jgi:heme-degrading monooxygenase HmoA
MNHARRPTLAFWRTDDRRPTDRTDRIATKEPTMSVVKINVLEVPEGRGEVLEQRFSARAGEVEKVDGFESFELLRPTEGTDRYLVVTRWRDEDAFQAWMSSDAFSKGHARSQADAEPAQGAGHPGGHPHGGQPAEGQPTGETVGHPGGGQPGEGSGAHPGGGQPGGGPAAVGSELWGFDIVTSATKAG